MTREDDLLLGALGFDVLGVLSPASSAHACYRVRTPAGHLRLWTRWPTGTHIARAAAAALLTLDLPHIPRLLESSQTDRWTLHDLPQGVPLWQVLKAQDLRSVEGLGESQKSALLHSLGQLLAQVHAQPAPPHCVGELPRPHAAPATRSLHGHLSEWLGRQDERHEEVVRLGAMALRHELRAFHPTTPCVLTHGAIGAQSVWVDEQTMEVSALCGWGEARVLPRAAEFAYLVGMEQGFEGLGPRALKQLYASYGMARTMDMERRERFFLKVVIMEVLCGVRAWPHEAARADLIKQLSV